MTKTLATLPADIDRLFYEGKIVDEANLTAFVENLASLLRTSLAPKVEEAPTIRMSKLGIPNRKLWYEHNTPIRRTQSSHALKFVYGHAVEQLILFLAKEAGHTVEDEQKEVDIDGVLGHQDGKVDGVTIDVKSASSYAFKKFSERQLFGDDPFGYIAQLSAYTHCNQTEQAAFIGVNKENGEIAILPLEKVDQIDPKERIKEIREFLAKPEPPIEKCYSPVSYKTSENLTLSKNCKYCPYSHKCWSDSNNGDGLRYFQYANEIVPLVKVVTTPRVEEVFLTEPEVGET